MKQRADVHEGAASRIGVRIALGHLLWFMFASAGIAQSPRPTGLILDPTAAPPLQAFEKSLKALAPALDNRRLFGPVKDQQACGSCTVFASTGLLESALVRDGKVFRGDATLAEQLTIDCVAPAIPRLCADGSDFPTILGSLRDSGTTNASVDYVAGRLGSAYVSSFNACVSAIDRTTSSNYAFRTPDFAKIGATTVEDIKQAINTYGAVVTSLYVTQSFGGADVIVMQPCTSGGCGWHAIVLLGWDDGRQAFLGRNSWGASFGDNGYFWIAYGEVSRYSVSQLAVRENGVYVARSAMVPYNYVTPPDPNLRSLTVAKSGAGTGTITSNVGGIDCGAKCTTDVAHDTVVDLMAVANANSDFGAWLGNCQTGTPSNICRIRMSESSVVFADFSARPTTALDPRIVGIVGADFATRFAAIPFGTTRTVDATTTFSDEITKLDNLVVSTAAPTLVFDRYTDVTGHFDRESNGAYMLLYARQLTLDASLKGKTVSFVHAAIAADSLNGINGAVGANGANGSGEVNRSGLPGRPGAQGGSGQDGRSKQYPQMVLAFEQILWSDGTAVLPGSVTLRFDFQGIGGGAGGNGGRGGNGGNGAQGKEGATGLFGCLDGPGSSGNGGDGGVGGLPGDGGDGGNGADLFTFSDFAQLPLFNTASLSLAGAPGGAGGHGGDSGIGGAGGPAAPGNGFCGPGRSGSNGNSPSANLGVGTLGAHGSTGSYVSYALSQHSTAKVADAPVIEYVNTLDFPNAPGGHFFYTNSVDEAKLVDSGAVGHFTRTGRSFNAGGSKALCRFYGSTTPGPNSHFFSIDERECLFLQSIQVIPAPGDTPQWNYEGTTFSETPPITTFDGKPTACDAGLTPVYRYYNNAFQADGVKNSWDSNHRYGTDKAALDAFAQANNWRAEGIAFCARP